MILCIVQIQEAKIMYEYALMSEEENLLHLKYQEYTNKMSEYLKFRRNCKFTIFIFTITSSYLTLDEFMKYWL